MTDGSKGNRTVESYPVASASDVSRIVEDYDVHALHVQRNPIERSKIVRLMAKENSMAVSKEQL